MFNVLLSIPIVDITLGSNFSVNNFLNNDVFPTPESPKITNLYLSISSYIFFDFYRLNLPIIF